MQVANQLAFDPGWALNSDVAVDLGGEELVSVITESSADRLGLKPGDAVAAVTKSTEVMISK